ncbi:hypothetical protein WMW72_10570 [Paenibacillus filicis]|uniref:Uncharacterized protein n=1 Tax=Paenibacillus filicis TaxID=669464 RepID=A0ABU9DHJ6_9BACL
MIESAIVTFCRCCQRPADICPNDPHQTYEEEVPLKDRVTEDARSA